MSKFVKVQDRIIGIESIADAEVNTITGELKVFSAAGSVTFTGHDADRLWAMLCRMSSPPDEI